MHINVSPDGEVLVLFFVELESPPSLAAIFEILKRDLRELVGVITYAVRKKWEVLGRNYLRLRIVAFSPRKIIYASCNPTTLARDLNMLCQKGYSLNRLQPIDMFPHTYHIETIAEFVIQTHSGVV
ncbi:MAG: hypothetical protein HY878_00040 [Deltaproteobacteria bacterium]|nr:hypothetical protein [Deltaproteobacteria bacterium]